MSAIIYTLSDPNTGYVRYVGKTSIGLSRRLSNHLSRRENTHVSRWIHSLNQSPIIDEIDRGNDQEWPMLERFWIQWYRTHGYDLTNHAVGGEGGTAGVLKSPAWKTKIGIANQGEKNGQAKLTTGEVEEIKRLLQKGELLQREIADKFEVSRRTVGFISRGERWASVDA